MVHLRPNIAYLLFRTPYISPTGQSAALFEYAVSAAIPYGLPGFYIEFRKWQAQAPVNPAEEYAASDRQGKTSPRPDILVLDDGATLRARGGLLEVFSLGITTRFDAGPHHRKPNAIIFAGWGLFLDSGLSLLHRS